MSMPRLDTVTSRRPKAGRTARAATPPQVALGNLDERLGYFVRRLQIEIFQNFIQTLAPLALSPAQYSVLTVIGANGGLSQAQLGATLGIERARLARMLHLMETRELTERRAAAGDRRQHALHLTRAGQKLLARAKTLAEAHEASVRSRMGSERHRMLLDALRELYTAP